MSSGTRKELTLSSSPQEKLDALKSAADTFGSDLVQIICRDADDNLLSVSVHASGDDAVALAEWLTEHAKESE